MLKINLMHNFLRVLVLRNKKLDNRVWIMSDAIKYQKICIHETLNIKIYFLASGNHVQRQCPQELMTQFE